MSTDVTDDLTTVDVDHSPTKASSYAAVIAGFFAAVTSAPFSLLTVPLGFGGVAIMAGGLFVRKNRSWVTFGAAGLLLSVLISGLFGTPGEMLLISAAGTVLAWDLGQHAISLGDQIGRHSKTWRNEALHGSATAIVAMLSAAFGYVVYSSAGGGQPVAAVIMLSLGIVFLVWAIRT